MDAELNDRRQIPSVLISAPPPSLVKTKAMYQNTHGIFFCSGSILSRTMQEAQGRTVFVFSYQDGDQDCFGAGCPLTFEYF